MAFYFQNVLGQEVASLTTETLAIYVLFLFDLLKKLIYL